MLKGDQDTEVEIECEKVRLWGGKGNGSSEADVEMNSKKVKDVLRRLEVLHYLSFNNVSYLQASE